MLVMRPRVVEFGARTLEGVERVSIDSYGEDMAEAWDREGPSMVFADAVRRRTVLTIAQPLGAESDLGVLGLGELEQLRVRFMSGGDARQSELRVDGVVQSVTHRFNTSGVTREIRLLCVSDAGDEDPVVVVQADAQGGGS